MKSSNRGWILLAAVIASAGAAIHAGATLGGAAWYAFFRAPPAIVASAQAGTWLAPVSALVIAALMAICAAYALSAAGVIRRLPLLRTALATIAGICLLRGLLLIPLAIKRPDLVDTFETVAGAIWLLAGIGFAVGFRAAQAWPNNSFKPKPLRGSA